MTESLWVLRNYQVTIDEVEENDDLDELDELETIQNIAQKDISVKEYEYTPEEPSEFDLMLEKW